jgi:hypothetical protein
MFPELADILTELKKVNKNLADVIKLLKQREEREAKTRKQP